MNHIYLLCDNTRIEVDRFIFNGGEVSIKIKDLSSVACADHIRIVANLQSSDDLMTLLMVNDAVRRNTQPTTRIDATLPYIPYGRQDRVCNSGEAFSLKVAAQLINSCGFTEVTTYDPHSDVTPALIDNVRVVPMWAMIVTKWAVIKREYADAILVSPDAGANKKTLEVCKALKKDFIRADKIRDVSTGNIVETVVYHPGNIDKPVLIVDDICDGGMTFIKLAEALREKGATKVGLYVTHGIFSKGKKPLLEVIDNLYYDSDWTQ